MSRGKNYVCQLLNVHATNDVRQTEMHTAEPLIFEPSPFEVEIAIEELKRYKPPCIDKILSELIKAGGNILLFDIHRIINSIWNKGRTAMEVE